MTLSEQTLTFAAKAPGLHTRKALGEALMTLLDMLGATRYACIYLRREAGGLAIDRSISNAPRLFQELYLARGYDADDPVFQNVLRAGSCGYWDEQTRDLTLTRAQRRVMDFAGEFDMKDGFTKRVALDHGGVAIMMACGNELLRGERARAAFRMAFDVFANEGARLLKVGEAASSEQMDVAELSRTQLRVLMMRSEGLTNRDIAQSMGRTEKTVECHVTEILRRLGARNMIDAIRIATRAKIML
jgi:DNA-binding CsgD family transcriptional regulator